MNKNDLTKILDTVHQLKEYNQYELAFKLNQFVMQNLDELDDLETEQRYMGEYLRLRKKLYGMDPYIHLFIKTMLISATVAITITISTIFSFNYIIGDQLDQITNIARFEANQVSKVIIGQLNSTIPDIAKAVQKEIPLISNRLQNEIPNITDKIIKNISEADTIDK